MDDLADRTEGGQRTEKMNTAVWRRLLVLMWKGKVIQSVEMGPLNGADAVYLVSFIHGKVCGCAAYSSVSDAPVSVSCDCECIKTLRGMQIGLG